MVVSLFVVKEFVLSKQIQALFSAAASATSNIVECSQSSMRVIQYRKSNDLDKVVVDLQVGRGANWIPLSDTTF